MTQTGTELLAELRLSVLDMFQVPNELLPPSYQVKQRHNRKGEPIPTYRDLASVENQFVRENPVIDPRDVSVKFDGKQNVTSGTPERLAAIAHYRQQAESGVEEFTPPNGIVEEHKLYRAELLWAAALIREGVMEPFDSDDGFDQ